jgi:hypothetical protein
VRESLRKWVTPPDPSTNHNIACSIQHGGTAQWFFRSGKFRGWKSTGSLLWIYGKRKLSLFVLDPLLVSIRILSRVRKEHYLVSRHLALCATTDLCRVTAPLSFKTSKPFARRDWRLLLTFISTSGTLIRKIVGTSSHRFSSNSLLGQVPVVAYSTAFIWGMTRGHGRPAKLLLCSISRICSQFLISPQFTLSWTRSTNVRIHMASRRLANKFSLLSRSSWTFASLIFTYAPPAALNSIFGLRFHRWHFIVCPFMTKADRRKIWTIT